MDNNELNIYLEFNKKYDKAIMKLMSLSSSKAIEKNKKEFITTANEYINKLNQDSIYIEKIKNDIAKINEYF